MVKNIQTPSIRFISEGKIIHLYAGHYSPDSPGIWEMHDNLIRQRRLQSCALHTQSNKARDSVPDFETFKSSFTILSGDEHHKVFGKVLCRNSQCCMKCISQDNNAHPAAGTTNFSISVI